MSHSHAHGHGHFHSHDGGDGPHAVLMRRASYASVVMATVLLLSKFYVWWETDSLAMLSSFTDSVFDVVMSLANMLALRYALKPADEDHSFGHTSIEDIAGLAQCVFIGVSMGLIVWHSVERIITPAPILTAPELGIGVSAIGMIFTMALVTYQGYVAKKTGSLIVAADRTHYVSDILFNLGVMAAYVFSSYMGIALADPVIAIIIAGVVLWSMREVAIRSFNNLMDREMQDEEKARINTIVSTTPGVIRHHHLKTRHSGVKSFIQMHVDMDADLNFREVHAITDALEEALYKAFPAAEVIIHPEPVEIT